MPWIRIAFGRIADARRGRPHSIPALLLHPLVTTILWRRARRPVAVLGAGAIVVSLAALGLQHTLPPVRPHMVAGSIWLASKAIGELTLVDGVSAQVSASVEVTAPNGHFDVTQLGQNGYALDADSGQLIAISGATQQKSSARPIANAATGITVYPTSAALFAVDRQQRIVQAVDPDNLTPLGEAMELPSTETTLASDGRTLWAADPASGELASFDATSGTPIRRLHHDAFDAGASGLALTIADGRPVLVDRGRRSVSLFSPATGEVIRSMPLQLRDEDLVSGSPRQERVLAVQPGRGLLFACGFADGGCGPSLPFSAVDTDLGPAVEAGEYAFIPDYTTRTVWIVNLADGQARQTERLFDEAVHFELSVRDGIVFYNDTGSEKAGIIDVTGQVRRINKYDPAKPVTSVLASGASFHPSASPTPTSMPVPNGTADPGQTEVASFGPNGTTSPPSDGAHPGPQGPGRPLPVTSGPPTPGDPPRIVRITATPATPEVDQQVVVTADVTGAVPDHWAWTLTRPDGQPEAAGSTAHVDHVFSAPGEYTITLTVVAGTRRDEQSTTVTVIPAPPPVHCGDTLTTSVILRTDLTCSGTALTVAASDVIIDLDGHHITGSGSGYGITAEKQANISIRNGTITKFGIHLDDVPDSDITNLHLIDGGILVKGSDNLEIQGSEIRGGGMEIRTSFAPSITDTTIVDGILYFRTAVNSILIANCNVTDSTVTFWDAGAGVSVVRNVFTRVHTSAWETDRVAITGNSFLQSAVFFTTTSRRGVVQDNEFSGADVAISASDVLPIDLQIERNVFRNNGIGVEMAKENGLVQFYEGSMISGNTFIDNDTAGIFLEAVRPSEDPRLITIAGNTFISNGKRPGGKVDSAGRPVNDGLHINVPPDSRVEVRGNITRDNADFGIEAVPGSVIDGGDNRSTGDPSGCLGVACA